MTSDQADTVIALLTTISTNMVTGAELQVILSWLGAAVLFLCIIVTILVALLVSQRRTH